MKSALNMLSFEQSVFLNKAKIMFKVANSLVPQYICDLFQRRSEIAPHTSLRSITNQKFTIPKPNLTLYKDSISYSGQVVWNSIPNQIKYSRNCSSFSENVVIWLTTLSTGIWKYKVDCMPPQHGHQCHILICIFHIFSSYVCLFVLRFYGPVNS